MFTLKSQENLIVNSVKKVVNHALFYQVIVKNVKKVIIKMEKPVLNALHNLKHVCLHSNQSNVQIHQKIYYITVSVIQEPASFKV